MQHILAGCTLLANHEYLKRHNHVLSIFAIEWCKVNGLIDENESWYNFNWKTGQVIEGKGKKVLWDFEFAARKTNSARRPDLILEENDEKRIWIVDMACPMERNIEKKKLEKLTKYQQLAFELREKRPNYIIKIVPLILGCCGGGINQLKMNIQKLINNERLVDKIICEMVKVALMDSESITRKVLSGLIQSE